MKSAAKPMMAREKKIALDSRGTASEILAALNITAAEKKVAEAAVAKVFQLEAARARRSAAAKRAARRKTGKK